MAENMVLSFDGTKLFVNKEVDMDCRAVCVIVHGLCEHQGRYDYLAEKMHEMGFGTYRFDHRGHGRSEGERTYYDDFNQLLDDVNVVVDMAVSENSALPVFLLGHSMGGFAVALYGAKYPNKNLRGIITSGALTQDNPACPKDWSRTRSCRMSWGREYALFRRSWIGTARIRTILKHLPQAYAMPSVTVWRGSKPQ